MPTSTYEIKGFSTGHVLLWWWGSATKDLNNSPVRDEPPLHSICLQRGKRCMGCSPLSTSSFSYDNIPGLNSSPYLLTAPVQARQAAFVLDGEGDLHFNTHWLAGFEAEMFSPHAEILWRHCLPLFPNSFTLQALVPRGGYGSPHHNSLATYIEAF